MNFKRTIFSLALGCLSLGIFASQEAVTINTDDFSEVLNAKKTIDAIAGIDGDGGSWVKADSTNVEQGLANANRITHLLVRGAKNGTLKWLDSFDKLNALALGCDKINDFSTLGERKNLQTLLLIGHFNNLPSLKSLDGLRSIYLRGILDGQLLTMPATEIIDIETLKDFKNLRDVYVRDLSIKNLSKLKENKNILTLGIIGKCTFDMAELKELDNINYLILNNLIRTPFKDLVSSIGAMKNLKVLYLEKVKFNDRLMKELKTAKPQLKIETIN